MLQIKVIRAYGVEDFEESVNVFLRSLHGKGIDPDKIYLDYVFDDGKYICFIEWEV